MAPRCSRRTPSLSWFLVTALTGLGVLPAPTTTPAEGLVCVPKPASAVEDLDYNKFSGDWREILKSKHGPVLLHRGAWRFDFDTNTFTFSAARSGNETCIPAIVGKVHKVLPVGKFQLEYDFFGQPVRETLAVVATDYGSYAILHRCGQQGDEAHSSVCAPDATHVSVLARHVLEEDTSRDIVHHLDGVCVPNSVLESHEFDEACPLPSAEDPSLTEVPAGKEMCFLDPSAGFCSNQQTIYYYDRHSRSCKTFSFTGCGGNDNHFLTQQECLEKCEKPLEEARVQPAESEATQCPQLSTCGLACPHCCQRREEDGCIVCNCLASEMDAPLKEASCLTTPEQCPAGCQSREASESCFACECPTPDGTMKPALEYIAIQRPVSCPMTCVKQMSSRGVPRCHCPSHGVCKLPLMEGSCHEKIPRYFFNVTSGFCDVFTYTGCDGNENNFASHEDCLAECEDPCRLPMDPGRCNNDTQERYYYNSQTGLCETFEYGGCEGNENNFAELESCKTRCEDVCSQPQDPGPCYAYLRRFYYDKIQDRCLPFIFGGCLGNGNNFYTSAQCNRHCRSHIAEDGTLVMDRGLCHLPLEEGLCNPSTGDGAVAKPQEVRFYYDVRKEECVRFNYHGCGGNDNNFRTIGGCNLTCFGVQATVAKVSASCPESIECSCGKFVVEEGGCKVCDCINTASKNNACALAAALTISALITTTLFSP
ncbi:papilin-like isoform X1 [Dermacentor silvarum]|uniref:papilin-like isoform X1 n=1 Tax=Dermacentor silvarum TaxID=543639 RepID=UPI0018980527|nr:papilin-like isoform X1 [Dermacentor silvarum]